MAMPEAQKVFRRSRITASEAAHIIGMSHPNSKISQFDIWDSKVNGIDIEIENDDVIRGQVDQRPTIHKAWMMKHWEKRFWLVQEEHISAHYPGAPGVLGTVCHPHHELIAATPDFLLGGIGEPSVRFVGEVKSVRRGWWNWGKELSDDIPYWYIPQVTIQSAVISALEGHRGLTSIVLASIHNHPVEYRVPFSSRLYRAIQDAVEEWWELYVITKTPPPLTTGTESEARFVERHNPVDKTSKIRLASDDESDLAFELFYAKRDLDRATAKVNSLSNQIKASIGDDAGMKGPFGKITWKKPESYKMVSAEKAKSWFLDNLGHVPPEVETEVSGARRFNTDKLRGSEEE